MTPALDVVVVSYRTRELLRTCLRSLELRNAADQHVVVVDNASGDGSAELVAAEFPEVGLIAAPRNLGFAAAANTGMAGGSAPYVLVLNPDTEVPPETLDALLELMERKPDVGICGCKLVRPDGRLDHAEAVFLRLDLEIHSLPSENRPGEAWERREREPIFAPAELAKSVTRFRMSAAESWRES